MKLKFWQKTLSVIANALYPCKIYGKVNLKDGNGVIVSNHFSIIDCVHYLNLNKEKPYFLAKKEACNNKFTAWLLGSYGAIPVDREKPDLKAMLSVIKVLKSGEKIVVFVEGTRNKTGTNELQEIKAGAGLFAVKVKCPIYPVMMLNKPKIFRRTKIIIGKPFELSDFYDKKLFEEDYRIMDDIIKEKMISEQEKLKKIIGC